MKFMFEARSGAGNITSRSFAYSIKFGIHFTTMFNFNSFGYEGLQNADGPFFAFYYYFGSKRHQNFE